VIVAMAFGITLAWIAGKELLGYDPVARYTAAMDLHRTIKRFQPDLSSLRKYAFLNSVEFIMAAGAPLLLLFLLSCGPSLYRMLRGSSSNLDAFSFALFLSIAVLYLVGQTRGEVARLWLFLLAPISLVAAPTARSLTRLHPSCIQLVFAMQVLISFLTFMNMDFR